MQSPIIRTVEAKIPLILRRAQPCDLLRVAGVIVRRLKDERQPCQRRVLRDAHERLRRDAAVAQLRVPLLAEAKVGASWYEAK